MPSFEEARSTILNAVSPLPTERVMLLDAPGRVLAEDITASADLPLWDNSAMDGYAIKSADCRETVTLAVTEFIPAGGIAASAVEAGTAMKIMTGAPMPQGGDAVVPFEETEEGESWVKISGPVKKGQHIRFRGEDVREGEVVLAAG